MSKIKSTVKYTTLAGMITISAFISHSAIEVQKNEDAAQKVEQVVQGQCFEIEFMNSRLDLKQANGLSKVEVLNKIRSSKTDLALEMYRANNSTIGYTYSTVKKIWMNRKFHDGFSVCEKASNLAHEISHKVGFKHDVKRTSRRPYSAPYVVGDLVSKCCKQ